MKKKIKNMENISVTRGRAWLQQLPSVTYFSSSEPSCSQGILKAWRLSERTQNKGQIPGGMEKPCKQLCYFPLKRPCSLEDSGPGQEDRVSDSVATPPPLKLSALPECRVTGPRQPFNSFNGSLARKKRNQHNCTHHSATLPVFLQSCPSSQHPALCKSETQLMLASLSSSRIRLYSVGRILCDFHGLV